MFNPWLWDEASGERHGKRTRPASSPGTAVGGSPGSVHKKVPLAEQAAETVLQPLAELPAQAATQVLELPAQAAQKVLQPLAELLPAQAATELVQPGPGAALAELHNTIQRSRIRRTRILRIQKTSTQPLTELQHQWS